MPKRPDFSHPPATPWRNKTAWSPRADLNERKAEEGSEPGPASTTASILKAKAEPLYKIQTETNNVLSNIVDFQIIIDIDERNGNFIIYKGKDKNHLINTTSGSETFFLDIAFRIALSRISNLPRPNFIFLND